MVNYGVVPAGFSLKSLDVIKTEIEQAQRDGISPSFNILANSPTGQINATHADKLAEMWEVAQAVYRAAYPDSATDDALDGVAAITGATRLIPKRTNVTLNRLNLADGTSIPSGAVVSVGPSGTQYTFITAVTNSTGAPGTFTAQALSSEVGDWPAYAKSIDTIITPFNGWSAASAVNGTSLEPFALSDGMTLLVKIDKGVEQTVTLYTGDFADIGNATAAEVSAVIDTQIEGGTAEEANGYVRAETENDESGNAIEFVGGTAVGIIGFPIEEISGFNSNDGIPGRFEESDEDFRYRREQLLRVSGAATLEAIRAKLLETEDVNQAYVIENDTDVTDPGTGLPPHSFSCVVDGGSDADVATTIFLVKAAGIQTYGSSSYPVTDSQGITRDIFWDRAEQLEMYIDYTVTVDPDLFPEDGHDQIKAALVLYGSRLQIGEDVIYLQFSCVPFSIAGVKDVTYFRLDTVFPPVNASNIPIDIGVRAVFDTSRIRDI